MRLLLRLYERFSELVHEMAKFGTVGAAMFVLDWGCTNFLRYGLRPRAAHVQGDRHGHRGDLLLPAQPLLDLAAPGADRPGPRVLPVLPAQRHRAADRAARDRLRRATRSGCRPRSPTTSPSSSATASARCSASGRTRSGSSSPRTCRPSTRTPACPRQTRRSLLRDARLELRRCRRPPRSAPRAGSRDLLSGASQHRASVRPARRARPATGRLRSGTAGPGYGPGRCGPPDQAGPLTTR